MWGWILKIIFRRLERNKKENRYSLLLSLLLSPAADGTRPNGLLTWFLKSDKKEQIPLAFLVSTWHFRLWDKPQDVLDFELETKRSESSHLFRTFPTMTFEEMWALFFLSLFLKSHPLCRVIGAAGTKSCFDRTNVIWKYCSLTIPSASSTKPVDLNAKLELTFTFWQAPLIWERADNPHRCLSLSVTQRLGVV